MLPRSRPIPNTYWVEPDRLLAGEYPGAASPDRARQKFRDLLEAGLTRFIDLTQPSDGLLPYAPYLAELLESGSPAAQRLHHPITDMSVPRHPNEMIAILDAIEEGLGSGENVYVHCWGGIGRTGTVVGCYLVRRGFTGPQALKRVQALCETCEKYPAYPFSPQTGDQREYVARWQEWDRT